MPPSNPSLEEMDDSDSGHKCLGQEGALSTFRSIRSRSVGKPCTVASGPYLLTRGTCLSSAPVLQQQRGSTWKGGDDREATRHLPPLHLFLADHALVDPPYSVTLLGLLITKFLALFLL